MYKVCSQLIAIIRTISVQTPDVDGNHWILLAKIFQEHPTQNHEPRKAHEYSLFLSSQFDKRILQFSQYLPASKRNPTLVTIKQKKYKTHHDVASTCCNVWYHHKEEKEFFIKKSCGVCCGGWCTSSCHFYLVLHPKSAVVSIRSRQSHKTIQNA